MVLANEYRTRLADSTAMSMLSFDAVTITEEEEQLAQRLLARRTPDPAFHELLTVLGIGKSHTQVASADTNL